jgi:hypothetical protein
LAQGGGLLGESRIRQPPTFCFDCLFALREKSHLTGELALAVRERFPSLLDLRERRRGLSAVFELAPHLLEAPSLGRKLLLAFGNGCRLSNHPRSALHSLLLGPGQLFARRLELLLSRLEGGFAPGEVLLAPS